MRKILFIVSLVISISLIFLGDNIKAATKENHPNQAAASGFYISNGKLYDANGKEFIMQGINFPYCWYQSRFDKGIDDIAAKNANCVRIVCSNGKFSGWRKTELDELHLIIEKCKSKKMIPILEVHDTVGYGEQSNACSLDDAANYWVEMKNALNGQEKYVIVNIGNEPYGNNNVGEWYNATRNALKKMREHGIANTIMIDAPNWGQDWSGTMKDSASAMFREDPEQNLIFSIHMYGVYSDPAKVNNYIQSFVEAKLPLCVGEFASDHQGAPVAAETIMEVSKNKVSGYLGWSWSGNSGGAESCDIVNGWDPEKPTNWGKMILADLISAVKCSIFDNGENSAPVVYAGPDQITNKLTINLNGVINDDGRPDGRLIIQWSKLSGSGNVTFSNPSAPATSATFSAKGEYLLQLKGDDGELSATDHIKVIIREGIAAEITYTKNDWGAGFTGKINILNSTDQEINGWTLKFTFKGDQKINTLWNGLWTQTEKTVTITNASYNATIPINKSIEIGFNATYSGSNEDPSDFVLTSN